MTDRPRVVLTGATGFIGTHLLSTVLAGTGAVAVARGRAGVDAHGITWIDADLSRPSTLAWPAGADTLIYAAQSRQYRDGAAGAADMVDVNVRSFIALLSAGASAGLCRVIYLSTGNVYARAEVPIGEDAPVNPGSFYAATKQLAEMAVEGYASTVECTILRLFTVYGPGQDGMLIPRLFDRIAVGAPVTVGPTGGLLLSPLYVDDLCTLIGRLLAQPPQAGCRVYNVGGPDVVTMRELALGIGAAIGMAPVFDVINGEPRSGWAASVRTLEADTQWSPSTTLREGLARTAAARPWGTASGSC